MNNNAGMWATIVTKDGLTYEGVVEYEPSQGIYIYVGGDSSRLMMFPWTNITRVGYKRE